ncbi:DNA repair protein complementing XP-A cells homolog [Zerene cesonia]|uniref:DNA repair protein complementing XP-A cells homolog n=1 Tax=Zerene cesonia TaxID=33412 RepID=UPI0018E515A2|nr:DNA repair protein complementing XP-A cells homolog [Zerene cesonia]
MHGESLANGQLKNEKLKISQSNSKSPDSIKDKSIVLDKQDIQDVDIEKDVDASLSAAQRARAERNRQRAKALREARLVKQPLISKISENCIPRAIDSGGGFLLEETEEDPLRPVAEPAPIVHHTEQPHCLECERPFPQSYLFDTFDYSVCDECRDDNDKHVLITRTEAKSEYLLKDCDLDARPPPLRCVRRRNPHRARFAEMRLYLRAQVEARALEVWGSAEQLERERAERDERRERATATAQRRRLRALRMDVRSSLYDRTRDLHEHDYGPERYDADNDVYERTCACGHVQTYEKM